MLFRPTSSLFLVLLSALGALATLGNNVALQDVPAGLTDANFGGGYWFQEVHASSAAVTDAELQAAAKAGYLATKSKAPNVKTAAHKTGVKAAPIVVALHIPGKGTIVATSIKVGEAKQSAQTCAAVTWKHRNWANCAEPNSVSIAVQQGWIASAAAASIPAGSKMAIYGKPGRSTAEGFQNPCADGTEKGDGCQRFLAEHPHIKLVNPASSSSKRAVEFVV